MQKPNRKSRQGWFAPNFTQPSVGTEECPAATELPTVTGNDTMPTPPASKHNEPKSNPKVLTDDDYRTLPAFTIRGVSCCGLMEVSGIQPCMSVDNFRNVICGLQKTFVTTITQFRKLQKQHRKKAEDWHKTNQDRKTPEYFHYVDSQIAMQNYQQNYKTGLAGQFVFTYIVHPQHPDKWFETFGKYVTEHSLGEIWISPKPFYNPNSHRHVRTVLFSVNNEGWWKFVKSNMTEQQYDDNNIYI